MNLDNYSTEELLQEIQVLQTRLTTAEDTLETIHQGAVDAFVIATPEGEKVFTLQSGDYTYRLLIEQMSEGAVIVTSDGGILYANQAFANLVQIPLAKIIGSKFQRFILERDVDKLQALMKIKEQNLAAAGEFSLINIHQQEISVYINANSLNINSYEITCFIVTDLTEKHQNEQIIASERFARSILEQVGESIVVCDETGKIIRASQVFHTLCGTNPLWQNFDNLISLFFSHLDSNIITNIIQSLPNYVPDIMAEHRFHINTVLQGQTYQGVEVYFQRPDGQQFDLFLNARPLLNSIGEIIGAIVNLTDITERKRQEAEIHQAKLELEIRVAQRTAELTELNKHLLITLDEIEKKQQKLWEQAQLLDLAHDTILTKDINSSVITFWNNGGEKMYGWTKAEAIGKVSHKLLKTQFPQPLAEIQAQVLKLGYWEGELIHSDKNGTYVTVSSRWVLQKDESGKPVKILEINNDITQQKQKEADLKKSETKFRSLTECLPIGVFLTDKEGKIIYTNPYYQKISGLTIAATRGKNWLDFIHADDREKILKEWLMILNNSPKDFCELDFCHEVKYFYQDNQIHYARIHLAPMLIEQEKMSGYIGIVEDITEIRAVEKMKKDFISIASHELRTPLTAINGALGLLAGKVYDKNPEKRSQMINIAAAQTARLVRLVNDILALQKLESGNTILVKQSCDAANLIIDSVNLMQPEAEKNHINFNINTISIEIWVNPDAIIQTLTNLLSNAIKFSTPCTTITVSNILVDSQETQAQIFAHLTNNSLLNVLYPPYVMFQVQDQGQGIPADKLETIFGWFQQVDSSDSREKGGTGLGLSICRNIIQQHEGQIWAESNLGQGSTFFFTLPLRENHNENT
ncbi:PAS domain S-box protein [Anabaena sphaerica FACHB-251]|uniref:histidine kinase n=1 Tax=Anabaena sphaerica FACHB-251 TaxID=2692883 RepID=A0A926WLU4_9NOST|nr:PAS domain S-box protein [Anabaena sphaerica]MBD2296507.1 PAS domain S-box protein [Anabaena sphaerica FACHB-251]